MSEKKCKDCGEKMAPYTQALPDYTDQWAGVQHAPEDHYPKDFMPYMHMGPMEHCPPYMEPTHYQPQYVHHPMDYTHKAHHHMMYPMDYSHKAHMMHPMHPTYTMPMPYGPSVAPGLDCMPYPVMGHYDMPCEATTCVVLVEPKFTEHLRMCKGKKICVRTVTDRLEGTLEEVSVDHLTLRTDKRLLHIRYGNIVYFE